MKLDAMVDQAWREFRAKVADGLEALPSGRLRIVFSEDAGREGSPYVDVAGNGETVRILVPVNKRLAESHRIGVEQKRRLRELGLRKIDECPPGTRGAIRDVHQVEETASIVTAVLRDVYGVLHPTFLEAYEIGWGSEPREEFVPASEPVGAVYPDDQQQLDALVEDAVSEVAEQPPFRDDDGDLAVVTGTSVVYVHTAQREPLIRIFAVMVLGLTDVAAADAVVGELNRDVDGVKFERRDEQIIASMDLVAYPFAREHLQMLLAHVCEVVSRRDLDVAERVGGRVFLDVRNFNGHDDEAEDDTDDAPVDCVWDWEIPPN